LTTISEHLLINRINVRQKYLELEKCFYYKASWKSQAVPGREWGWESAQHCGCKQLLAGEVPPGPSLQKSAAPLI